jgi:plastocyanin
MFSYEATPSQIGYVPGLRREVEEVLVHAERLAKNMDDGNLPSAISHAEHIVNVIEGQFGANFGDLSRDGKVQNPGDGYGLLKNGAQDGYIEGVLHHVLVAAASPAAPSTLQGGADDIKRMGTTLDERVIRIRDLSLAIAAAKNVAAARADTDELIALAREIAGDDDGVEAIYTRVQAMSAVALAPVAPGTSINAPPPVRIVADARPQLVIVIGDDTFAPLKQTVAAGTTIVWRNEGASAHTVTADDGSFDSQAIPAGGEFSHTFSDAEAFPYFCSLHGGAHGEGMSGAVEVSGSQP